MKVKVEIEWEYTWCTSPVDTTEITEGEMWEHVKKLEGETPIPGTFRVEFTK